MVTFNDCVLWISCLRRSGSIVVAVLLCWMMCPCCTSHSWRKVKMAASLFEDIQNGCNWWHHSDDASQVMTLCWLICYLTTVLTQFKHCKTNMKPVSTCLEWRNPLLAVGDLKIRESTTRSKVPILALPELELLIHQCNAVALAVSCPLALLKQCHCISNQTKWPNNIMQRVKTNLDPACQRTILCTRGWYISLIFMRRFN